MKSFEYLEPISIAQASSMLAQHGEDAKAIAGGTELIVDMKRGHVRPKYLIDLKTIPGLDYMNYDPEIGIEIGALTSIRSIERSTVLQERFPILHQATRQFATISVRTMATLGGNLCNGSPSADMAPSLIALSAVAKIAGPNGEKKVPLEEFFIRIGNTVLESGEILTAIAVPKVSTNTKGAYVKYATRGKSDLQIVGVAVVMILDVEHKSCTDVKIVLGNVAPKPIRAHKAEAILKGNAIEDRVIEECAEAASREANPRAGSFRASSEYKKAMAGVFTKRALKEALTGSTW